MNKVPPLCGLGLGSQGCEGLADEGQPILVSIDPEFPQYAVGKRICPECLCFLVTNEIAFETNPSIRVYLGLEQPTQANPAQNTKPVSAVQCVLTISKEEANDLLVKTRGQVRGYLILAGLKGGELETAFEAVILPLELAFELGEYEKIESLAQVAIQIAKSKGKGKKIR